MSPPCMLAVLQALALYVSHVATCIFVFCKDVSGTWDACRLYPKLSPLANGGAGSASSGDHYKRRLLGLYLRQGRVEPIYLLVILPIALQWCMQEGHHLPWNRWLSPLAVVLLPDLWLGAVHRALHTPLLYRRFHKYHHGPLREFLPTATWKSGLVEFLAMELPPMLIPTMFGAAPLLATALLVRAGVCATLNHAPFRLSLIGGDYHFLHHKLLHCNYAEAEWLDRLWGTHHETLPKRCGSGIAGAVTHCQ